MKSTYSTFIFAAVETTAHLWRKVYRNAMKLSEKSEDVATFGAQRNSEDFAEFGHTNWFLNSAKSQMSSIWSAET